MFGHLLSLGRPRALSVWKLVGRVVQAGIGGQALAPSLQNCEEAGTGGDRVDVVSWLVGGSLGGKVLGQLG